MLLTHENLYLGKLLNTSVKTIYCLQNGDKSSTLFCNASKVTECNGIHAMVTSTYSVNISYCVYHVGQGHWECKGRGKEQWDCSLPLRSLTVLGAGYEAGN